MATDNPDIPDRIGPYEIVRLIGQGGMGRTFEAMRPDLGKPCALKVIHPHLAGIPKFREMFDNEARIGAQLHHGHIVGVIDRGEYQGRPYLVMERVDGVNLDRFLKALHHQKAGPLELSLVVLIMEGLLEGLKYAHSRLLAQQHEIGVIHHDITPGNILISSSGEVRLTDFGIARFVDESGLESKPIGTLLYMAPEQLMGTVSRQSDLYSLGVVFHEMLAGRPPLAKVPELDRRAALLVEPIPPTGRDDLPHELDELRVALLQKHPEKRLRTALEALGMLARYPGRKANSGELADLYVRLIGPQSSGWTGWLRSAERRGEPAPAQLDWLTRLNQAQPKPVEPALVASPAVVVQGAREDESSGQDEDDQTRTRPWQASPPPPDANVASIPSAAGAERPPSTDDIRTRRHKRVARRRSKDNGTGPDGRVEAPSRRCNAVLQPVAVAAPSPPEAESPERVATDKLPPPTGALGGGPGEHDRTRRLASVELGFLASAVALLQGSDLSERVGDLACEVTP